MGATSSKNKTSFDDGGEVNFDHFQILRAIGKGSFGKVCIVQKKDSNQMYAMKYMNKSQCIEKDAVRNVLREIELLAMLEHPFLVNLWFSFQDAEDMFMVVDLLLGGDLRYHIQQNGRFDEERVHFYVCEIALALDYLREKHILHRDIKPDNILLDEEGHVHITDFNIATILNDGQLATSMTGTKPYMAPEVFDCALDECPGYSYAVDWWSLGVCAFEMLRGKRPFDIHSGTPITDVRHMFTTFKVHFPSSIQPSMKDLLKKLLCVNPLRRISTLEELSKHPSMADVNFNDVLERKIQPVFVPPKDHLNCDPTFELEEMIIEAKPLHKKKKRLSKQNSKKEQQGSMSGIDMDPLLLRLEEIQEEFMVYNRERELELIERERKEQEWQEELERHMNSVDPMANYRQDLKLPLRTNLHLSPSHHKGPFVNSADKSPAKSSLKGMELSKSPIKCTRATSPMRWLDSPRREWVQDKASPLAAVDIMGEVGSQEDSSSTSTDSPATTHQFRNIKVTSPQVSGNGEEEAKSQETELAQSSPNVASMENFYLWAENNSPVELSKKDNQNFQFSPTQVSRTKGQHFWNEHYRMSSSLSHDSDNDIGGGRILNQDSPLYKSEFGFPRQDSGTTDSMVSCCTSFSNPGNLADLSTPEVEALSK